MSSAEKWLRLSIKALAVLNAFWQWPPCFWGGVMVGWSRAAGTPVFRLPHWWGQGLGYQVAVSTSAFMSCCGKWSEQIV